MVLIPAGLLVKGAGAVLWVLSIFRSRSHLRQLKIVSGVQLKHDQLNLFTREPGFAARPVNVFEMFITRFVVVILYRFAEDSRFRKRSLIILSHDMTHADFRRLRVLLESAPHSLLSNPNRR